MQNQDDADADDDAAAAANSGRVGVVATSSIVSRGPRVRFSYTAPMGRGTARSGHLSCKEDISWVRIPGAPPILESRATDMS